VALWEIRLMNQPPVRVDVADDRNLIEEHVEFEQAHADVRWWSYRKRPSPFWQITDTVVVHREMIAGVLPKKPKVEKDRIGFV
jgi:hypothetical protein